MAARSPLRICLALSILVLSAVAQDSEDGSSSAFVPRASGASKLVRQNTNFALRLYCQHLDAHPANNFVLSPMSITQGLAQIYAGAGGETASQMRFVMQLTGDPTDVDFHEEVAALGEEGSGIGYNFSLANRLYIDEGFSPLDAYNDLLEDVYGAEAEVLDLSGSPATSTAEINTWVEDATGGKIADALPAGSLGPGSAMVLANALYFKADWAEQFNKGLTGKRLFHAGGGGNVTVDMMSLEAEFAHASVVDRRLQVLELPYRGGRFSMLVVLPDEMDGLADVEAAFCDRDAGDVGATFFDFAERMSERMVKVKLPRFTSEGSLALHDLLPEVGMRHLFSREDANLSGITGEEGLFLSSANHRAFMKVNEEGTEAAASTSTVAEEKMLAPNFVADRPFMYYVRDNENKALVMLGRMWDPESKA